MEVVKPGDAYSPELEAKMHQTIKKVSQDYEGLKFNTAIAALMTLLNEINHVGSINEAEIKAFLILLNPVAPHITEEMWEKLGFEGMLNEQTGPLGMKRRPLSRPLRSVYRSMARCGAPLR